MNYVSTDDLLFRRMLARHWRKLGLISRSGNNRLLASDAADRDMKKPVLRGIQIVGIILAFSAISTFVIGIFDLGDDYADDAFFVISIVSSVMGIVLVARSKFSQGIDEGAWLFFIVAFSVSVAVPFSEPLNSRVFWVAVLYSSGITTLLGYLAGSLLAWLSATWLIVDLTSATHAVVAQTLLLAGLTSLRSRIVWHRRMRQCACVRLCCLVAAYLLVDPFVWQLFTDDPPLWWTQLNHIPGPIAVFVYPFMPPLYLLWGWVQRDRAAIDAGLFCAVVALMTIVDFRLGLQKEMAMIVVGCGVVLAGFALRAFLHSGENNHRFGLTDAAHTVGLPWGWTKDDVVDNESWVENVLTGLHTRRREGKASH